MAKMNQVWFKAIDARQRQNRGSSAWQHTTPRRGECRTGGTWASRTHGSLAQTTRHVPFFRDDNGGDSTTFCGLTLLEGTELIIKLNFWHFQASGLSRGPGLLANYFWLPQQPVHNLPCSSVPAGDRWGTLQNARVFKPEAEKNQRSKSATQDKLEPSQKSSKSQRFGRGSITVLLYIFQKISYSF